MKIEILSVEDLSGAAPEIVKLNLFEPQTGFTSDLYSFSLTGWILGRNQPVQSLLVEAEGKLVKIVPVDLIWPRVRLRYPFHSGSEKSGFNTEISVVGLKQVSDIVISARFEQGDAVPVLRLRVRRDRLASPYQARLQPLMITSEGRSGSTWIMHLFGEHPDIVIHRSFPFETMAASYWIHLYKILTDPANHTQSTARLGFTDRPWNLGHNPYFTRPLISDPDIRSWFGAELVERTAAFCQQNIDGFYTHIAASQGEPEPRYFAEKNRGDHIPRLFFDLYPEAREIFVLRDFRDMACSMMAFNQRRGYVGVGPLDTASDTEFIQKLRPSIEKLMSAMNERKDRSFAVRYEDLILAPETTLPLALDYLGLPSDPNTISSMLAGASRPDKKNLAKNLASRLVPDWLKSMSPSIFAQLQSHKTSGSDPRQSIGRWKTDLTAEQQQVAHDAFGDLLEQAGYEV